MTQKEPQESVVSGSEAPEELDPAPEHGGDSPTSSRSRERESSGLVIDLTTGEPELRLVDSDFIHNRYQSARSWQRMTKRAIDVVVAAMLVLVLSPLFLVVAIAVAITSGTPVLFAQDRVGYLGEQFRFLKFRSMVHDAETRRQEVLDQNAHKTGPIFKIPRDPRVTKVGRIIRRASLDELPQLFHVLSGKMSLVGPRPPLPSEVATYGQRQLQRLTVKPGITCIWQISGRSELDFDTWIDMDLEYIENWSLWLDLKILVKTLPAVLSGRGAY